ncbi:MAG: hypothetical protein V1867_00545 [Candidatus Falkowbacteria bacterium]
MAKDVFTRPDHGPGLYEKPLFPREQEAEETGQKQKEIKEAKKEK